MPHAMVLAAGLGTRLRPLTNSLPKPLLPFGDKPLIEHCFAVIERAGLGPRVIVNTHYLAEAFETRRFSLEVLYSHEPVLRGTAGGIARARSSFARGPVVILTGDIVLEQVPQGFRESALGGGMVLAVAPRERGTGTVGLAEDGRVVRLRGQVFGEEARGGDYIGLMALGEGALGELPEWGCYIKDYALPLLARGGRIDAFVYSHGFVTPGDDVHTYREANLRWLDRERGGASFVGARAWISPGVTLERTIVGEGARVEGEGIVRNCVLFPGSTCRAPSTEEIVIS